jgi:MYXO-CTERM domain-containing protein
MGSCLNGVAQSSVCNGAGACEAEPLISCGQYACGQMGCKLDCADDLDCADGYACSESACVPAQPGCSDDRSSAVDAEGEVVEICTPYLCANAQCAEACSVSTDCAVGYLCDSTTMLCVAPPKSAEEDGGCGCRVRASTSGNGAAWTLLALWLGLGLRRRRRSA